MYHVHSNNSDDKKAWQPKFICPIKSLLFINQHQGLIMIFIISDSQYERGEVVRVHIKNR